MLARLMLFLCIIVNTMWSGKSMQLLCILALFAIIMMFVNIMLAV